MTGNTSPSHRAAIFFLLPSEINNRRRSCESEMRGFHMNPRQMLGSGMAAGAALNSLLAPVKAIAADVRPMRIKTIEVFNIEVPVKPTEVEAGVMNRAAVTRVTTESGARGYSFGGPGFGGGVPGRRPGATAGAGGRAGGGGFGGNTAGFQQ